VLEKERRNAQAYGLLVVLGMPALVAVASFLIGVVVLARLPKSWGSATAVYVGFSGFLAYMIFFVLTGGTRPLRIETLDPLCLFAVGLFVILVLLTFFTPIRNSLPKAYGVLFGAGAFAILGLLGRVWVKRPIPHIDQPHSVQGSLVMLASGFVVLAYGEVLRSSWLWVPPKEEDVRLGAWLLGQLAADAGTALGPEAARGRIFNLLIRLRLVGVTEAGTALTPKGLHFIRAAGEVDA
jgi:hypothetical protein